MPSARPAGDLHRQSIGAHLVYVPLQPRPSERNDQHGSRTGWAVVAAVVVIGAVGLKIIVSSSQQRSQGLQRATAQNLAGMQQAQPPVMYQPRVALPTQASVPQPSLESCPHCHGQGNLPDVKCDFCHGTGKSLEQDALGNYKDCNFCRGSGLAQRGGTCTLCGGAGRISVAAAQQYQQYKERARQIDLQFHQNAPQPTLDWVHTR